MQSIFIASRRHSGALRRLRSRAGLAEELAIARAAAAAALEGLGAAGLAALVADTEGRLLAANRLGAALLREGDALELRSGRLVANAAGATARLYGALAKGADGTILLPRHTRAPLLAALVQWKGPGASSGRAAGALLTLRDPTTRSHPDSESLRLLYPFTPTELKIVCALAAGRRAAAIAEDAGTSLLTVRTHIRNAIKKAGVHRQSELVALALRPPAQPAPTSRLL